MRVRFSLLRIKQICAAVCAVALMCSASQVHAASITVALYDFEGTAGNTINSLSGTGTNAPTLAASSVGVTITPVLPVYHASNAPNGAPGSTSGLFADAGYLLSADGDLPTTVTDNYGAEVWVRADQYDGFDFIFNNGSAAGPNNGWGLVHVPNAWGFLNSNVVNLTAADTPVAQWVHLAGVRDGGTNRLYVNGVEVASSVAGLAPPTNFFAIGAHPRDAGNSGAGIFNGRIDNLRIFTFNQGEFDPQTDLTQLVPEPSSFALLGFGLLGCLAFWKKRKNCKN